MKIKSERKNRVIEAQQATNATTLTEACNYMLFIDEYR